MPAGKLLSDLVSTISKFLRKWGKDLFELHEQWDVREGLQYTKRYM